MAAPKGNSFGPGGKRPGAGRKPGATNKVTKANIAKAEATGEMPLHVSLDIMRKRYAKLQALRKTKGVTEAQIVEAEDLTLAAAEKCTPYLHHKLQSMTHSVRPLDLSKLSLEELKQFRELRAKLSGDAT